MKDYSMMEYNIFPQIGFTEYEKQGIATKERRKKPIGKYVPSLKKLREEKYTGEFPEGCNVAVVLGRISNNLWDIDVDFHEIFPEFEAKINEILGKHTFTYKSGMKGYHFQFRSMDLPKNMSLTNQSNQSIDILSEGKVATLPPSIHVENGKPYEIIHDVPPVDITKDQMDQIFQWLKNKGFKPDTNKKQNLKCVVGDLVIPPSVITELNAKQEGNRQGLIISEGTRIVMRAILHFQEVSMDDCIALTKEMNENLGVPYKSDSKIKDIAKAVYNYGHSNLKGVDIKLLSKDFDIVANLMMNNYRFITIRGSEQMFYYDDNEGIYKENAESLIKQETAKFVFKCREKDRREIIATIKVNTFIDAESLFDSQDIVADNGVINKQLELEEHSPEYYTLSKLPFKIDPEAKNTKLWNHILTIIDPKDVNILLELLWNLISGTNHHKKMFIFYGVPNTQKTTLVEILQKIIGLDNFASEPAQNFLSGNRFKYTAFLGKRANVAEEIAGWTLAMIENMKNLIGGAPIGVEEKSKNKRKTFYPKRFTFIFTTNGVGKVYAELDNSSIISRYQFLIFRNLLTERDDFWWDKLFENKHDEETAISYLINVVLAYKRKGIRTKFATEEETIKILKSEMSLEDKFFHENRIIHKEGKRTEISEVAEAFSKFTGITTDNQRMGYILKKNGIKTKQTNSKTVVLDYVINDGKQEIVKFGI